MWFFIIFLIVPLLEIKLFIWVAGQIGILPAILLCVLTAILGTVLVRLRGLQSLLEARESLMQREMPVRALFDGVCLAMAGVLLIIPGFLTDILGFLLLLTPVRNGLFLSMGHHFGDGVEDYRNRKGAPLSRDPNVIEGEFTRLEDRDK